MIPYHLNSSQSLTSVHAPGYWHWMISWIYKLAWLGHRACSVLVIDLSLFSTVLSGQNLIHCLEGRIVWVVKETLGQQILCRCAMVQCSVALRAEMIPMRANLCSLLSWVCTVLSWHHGGIAESGSNNWSVDPVESLRAESPVITEKSTTLPERGRGSLANVIRVDNPIKLWI